MLYEVAIIGAGPAGVACAIQLKRSGIKPVVVEKSRIGGMLYEANLVENYPGFPNGIPGYKLAELMKLQFESEDIQTVDGAVSEVEFTKGTYKLKIGSRKLYSKVLVVSTGTKPKLFAGLKGNGSLISYETERFRNVKRKTFVIIGAGDLAFDYALRFGQYNRIILLNRSSKVKCIELLRLRCDSLKQFSYFEETVVVSAFENEAGKIRLDCIQKGNAISFKADHVIGAIGREQNTDFVLRNSPCRLKELMMSGKLFIIGDAANGKCRQSSVAAGDGVKTAMKIRSKLMSADWK